MRRNAVDEKLERVRNTPTPYTVEVGGRSFLVEKDVYPTSEVSELIIECLTLPDIGVGQRSRMWDYGSGTGCLAVSAALLGAEVMASDINPAAVECARKNAARFGCSERVDVRLGEGFSVLRPGELFDLIVSGLPWDDAPAATPLEAAMYDDKFRMRRALFGGATGALRKKGGILLTYSKSAQERYPLEDFAAGFEICRLRSREIKGEEHYALLVRPVGAA